MLENNLKLFMEMLEVGFFSFDGFLAAVETGCGSCDVTLSPLQRGCESEIWGGLVWAEKHSQI